MQMTWFCVVSKRRRGLKVNAAKSNVMVLNGEEVLKCEVHVDWVRFIFEVCFGGSRYR